MESAHDKHGAAAERLLDDFTAMAANITEAFTAALFLKDPAGDHLDLHSFHTLSDHLNEGARLSAVGSALGEVLTSGVPTQEPYFDGDASQLGLYLKPEPIRAYMIAPVGKFGVLWVDTRKAYRFTGKHLKLVTDIAVHCTRFIELAAMGENSQDNRSDLELIREILPPGNGISAFERSELRRAVNRIRKRFSATGALTVQEIPEKDAYLVTAAAGFSTSVRSGRLIKRRPGWITRAVDGDTPIAVADTGLTPASGVLFHSGEKLGFRPAGLVVVPWSTPQGRGALALVSSSRSPVFVKRLPTMEHLGRLLGLILTASVQHGLLNRVRRYDGESGLPSEGHFHELSLAALEEVRERSGSLIVLLASIVNMEEIYLTHSRPTVHRFLESYTDRLFGLARCRRRIGKFETGGFGLILEDFPGERYDDLTAKAQRELNLGPMEVNGETIFFQTAVAGARFPEDGTSVAELRRVARSRLRRAAEGYQ